MIKVYDFIYYGCIKIERVLWKIQEWALNKSNKLVVVENSNELN